MSEVAIKAPAGNQIAPVSPETSVQIMGTLSALSGLQEGVNEASQYKEFSKGDKVRGVFLGMTVVNYTDSDSGEMKTLDAVVWIDEEGNCWQNSGSQLVSTFRDQQIPRYTPVSIEMTGKKKVNKGTMNVFAVRRLHPNG